MGSTSPRPSKRARTEADSEAKSNNVSAENGVTDRQGPSQLTELN